MALIKLDDELDRWIEEVALLPDDQLDEVPNEMVSVPFVDHDLDPDMQWLDGYGSDAELMDDTLSLPDEFDDGDDDEHDDF